MSDYLKQVRERLVRVLAMAAIYEGRHTEHGRKPQSFRARTDVERLLDVAEAAQGTRDFYAAQETSDGLKDLSREFLGDALCDALARLTEEP